MSWTDGGVIGGAVTPLTADFAVDWDSLQRHLHALAGANLTGLLVNASMAEGGHLSPEERDQILRFAVGEVGDRVPVIATIYGASTSAAAAEAHDASTAGAQGILVYPHPASGGEPLDPTIPLEYFQAIWKRAGLPMLVFRTPASLAPSFGLEVLNRLATVPGVVAIKDSTGDLESYRGAGRRFLESDSPVKVLADSDQLLLDFLRAGAHGATVISAVVDTGRWVSLYANRTSPAADALHRQLARFSEAVYRPPFRDFRARIKEALRLDGVIAASHVRPPLREQERALAASRAAAETVG